MSQRQRRIPQESNESLEIIRGITVADFMALVPGFFIAGIVIAAFPPWLIVQGLIFSGIVVLLGVIAVFTAPEHYETTDWVSLHLGHLVEPSEYHHIEYNFDNPMREQTDEPEHDFLTRAWSPDQRTQDLLYIKKIYKSKGRDPGAIEMRNGDLVGAIKVEPANLTLATSQQWRAAVSAFTSLTNTLDHDIQIYKTTREFDVQAFLEPYDDRRADKDVREEPVLRFLLDEFLDEYPRRLEEHSTRIGEYYIIVNVSEEEVETTSRTDGITDTLAEWPVFSFVFGEDDEDEPEVITRAKQREALLNRLDQLKYQISEISDVTARLIDAEEQAQTISRAWTRERLYPGDSTEVSETGAVVPEQSDELDSDGETSQTTGVMG